MSKAKHTECLWRPYLQVKIVLTQGADNTSYVESCCEIIKVTLVPQNSPKFPTKTSLHQKVDVFAIFKSSVQPVKNRLIDKCSVCSETRTSNLMSQGARLYYFQVGQSQDSGERTITQSGPLEKRQPSIRLSDSITKPLYKFEFPAKPSRLPKIAGIDQPRSNTALGNCFELLFDQLLSY